jgi:streptogramin lyase
MVVVRDRSAGVQHGVLSGAGGRWRVQTPLAGPFEVRVLSAGDTLAVRGDVGATAGRGLDVTLARAPQPVERPASAWWLSGLPDGEEKRRFILDCTGCHQFNETRVMKDGRRRTTAEWSADVGRMLNYAGAGSGFPVIAAGRDPDATAAWLSGALGAGAARAAPTPTAAAAHARITEYDMPVPQDLPHDLAIDRDGRVLVTGMFTAHVFRVSPEDGTIEAVPIPVDKANPRAIEVGPDGAWWVLLGQPKQIARRDPSDGAWKTWDIGMYPHSVAIDAAGATVWFNGHFTRDPEQIGRLNVADESTELFVVPRHPALADTGGPLPYEQRIAPNGTVWLSELQGNRMIAYDPARAAFRTFDMPEPWSGPRRFDVANDGTLWIPAYSGNALVRLDPVTGAMKSYALPARDCLPYVARVSPRTGHVWLGTGAADAVLRFNPRTAAFDVFPLPTRGATVRHMAIDPASDAVWLAHGASPAVHPARTAKLEILP